MNDLLQEIKEYLRIDGGEEEDKILLPLIDTAKTYIKGATGKEYSGNPLEIMCIKLLLMHWYDGENNEIPFGVRSLLTQLQYRNDEV